MTGIENNPYYQGRGLYNGQEADVYYDHRQQFSWSVRLVSTGQWIDDTDIDTDLIELG